MGDPVGQIVPQHYRLLAPVLTGMVVRFCIPLVALAVGNAPGAFHEPDTTSYIEPAFSLLQDGTFSRSGEPDVFRTPGYPLFLTVGLRVGHVDLVCISLQVLLGTLTIVVVYRLAVRVGGTQVGLIAAWCFALEPLSALYASKLLSETVFTFLLVLCLERFTAYRADRSLVPLVQSAMLLVVAAYVRPVAYYLPIVMAGLLFFVPPWKSSSLVARSFRCVGFLTFCAALLIPWQVRNARKADYTQLSAVPAVNLYFWHTPGVLSRVNGEDFRELQKSMGLGNREVYFQLHPEQRDWTPGSRYRYIQREALDSIRESPVAFGVVYVQGVVATISDPGTSAFTGLFLDDSLSPNWRKAGVILFHGGLLLVWTALALLALVGLVICASQRSEWTWLVLLVVACYFILLSGGPVGYHRLRLPVMPIVSVYCGVGGASLLGKYGRVFRSAKVPARNSTASS